MEKFEEREKSEMLEAWLWRNWDYKGEKDSQELKKMLSGVYG